MLGQSNHVGENKKAVLGSPIIAKAVLRDDRNNTKVIVVFQRSTRQEFYWVFHAKSPRSSRRSWKPCNYFPRDLNTGNHYSDFGTFVHYYAASYCMRIASERVSHKKRLSALMNKTEHESILGNWQPQDPDKMSQDHCRERMQHVRSSRLAW